MKRNWKTLCLGLAVLAAASRWAAYAGEADVVAVKAQKQATGVYRFEVTVQHADTGWSHYADRWDVVAPDGTVLGSRVLAHPHVKEQPFTRSLSNVKIPDDVREVTIRAHDKVHQLGGKEFKVTLPQ